MNMKYCVPKPYRLLYTNHFGVVGVISYANSEAHLQHILTAICARKKLNMDKVQLQEIK
jgi:hypothetical protein